MNELWKYFECTRCGSCCKEIGLSYDPRSIIEMATHLGMTTRQLIEKHYGSYSKDGKYWDSDDLKRTPCPFLKHHGQEFSCAIYNVRPDGCRLYPMETDAGPSGMDCQTYKAAIDKLREEQSKIEI